MATAWSGLLACLALSPCPFLGGQKVQAPFSVSLKNFGHVLGSNVQSVVLDSSTVEASGEAGAVKTVSGVWALGEVFLPLGQRGLSY